MMVLFTDFGATDLYVPQVKLTLAQHGVPLNHIIDLTHDAPAFNPRASAHLLAALFKRLPPGAVVFAVVDPGVGSDRQAAIVETAGKWLVGPDNGLLSVVAAREQETRQWRIHWQPEELSSSFHGRDLFAPIAASLAQDRFPSDKAELVAQLEVSFGADELAEVIYIDHYGNVMTGLYARNVRRNAGIRANASEASFARVFSEIPQAQLFWYENSLGLIEIAANQASAAAITGVCVGTPVEVLI